MNAADIMTTDVVTVNPETEVSEMARLLLQHRISAAPVTDRDGHLVGIVSESDLVRRAECGRGCSWWLALFADKTSRFVHVYGTRAQDVMTRDVVSITKDASLAQIAHVLEAHGIAHVPVVDDGRLVGIVSRADILRGVATLAHAGGIRAGADDRVVRERILELLRTKTSTSVQAVSILVVAGIVYLWGIVDTPQEKSAIRIAAESIVGPGKVRDNLSTLHQVLEEIG